MKSLTKIMEKSSLRIYKGLGMIAVLVCFFVSCELTTEQDASVTYYEDFDRSITQYFNASPDSFSILSDILDTTGLSHLFKTYGDYTFLAPVNSAFESYFEENAKSSYEDFTVEELTELIKYHVFDIRIVSGAFNSGIVERLTLNLEYMVSGPSSDGSDILLNKDSKIISKDNIEPNGIIHAVDRVIRKPTASIYDWIKENETEYTIFLEAVDKTGLDEMLKQSNTESEIFYSGFITPDEKYRESNINSFADLAEFISPNDNNYTDSSNTMWSFIGSHFTHDVMSMSDAREEHIFFGTVGGATSKFGLLPSSADIALNYETGDFPYGLDIDEFNSNNLVSNGIVHVMDTMFQVPEKFIRTRQIFVYLDVPGIPYDSLFDYGVALWEEQGIAAKKTGGNGAVGSERYELGAWSQFWPRPGGPKHLPFEKTGDWLTLNAPYSSPIKSDHHRNNEWNDASLLYGQGHPVFFTFEASDDLLDVTRKFPYIIPGKYRLLHYTKVGPGRPTIKHFFNDVPVGGIVNLSEGLNFQYLDLGVVEILEGETEHFLRIQMVTPGKGFYVAIIFEPID